MWNGSSLPPHGPLFKPQRGEAPLAPLVTCPVLPGPFRRSGTVSNRLRFAPRSRRMKADRTLTMRLLIVATLFGAVMYGDEITLPLDDGNIQIRAQFIRPNGYGSDVPNWWSRSRTKHPLRGERSNCSSTSADSATGNPASGRFLSALAWDGPKITS